jgi:hypothetical protein
MDGRRAGLWRAKGEGERMRIDRRQMMSGLLGVTASALTGAGAHAQSVAQGFRATLAPEARKIFDDWYSAQTFHEAGLDAFWAHVVTLRAARRRKKAEGAVLALDDYVPGFPPVYSGPTLPVEIAKAWADWKRRDEIERPPAQPPDEIPVVADFLQNARQIYGFVPDLLPEREFKRRYAVEALRIGLTKAQVVRVYAFETGGKGTADMQSGIDPIKKEGKAISTALGYAQLLAANSLDELVKHGPTFADRLAQMATDRSLAPQRAKDLAQKSAILRRMIAKARSVPNVWASHITYARTPEGMGIHALNLDGDVGPWLQVIKLQGLREDGAKAGRFTLTPAELELMNLSGPATGLEMMLPAGRQASTPNFFERGGYGRNTIVRGKTGAELLAAIDKRMDDNSVVPGAIEFATVFDEISGTRAAGPVVGLARAP